MKRPIKKIASIFLVIAMVFSLQITGFADGNPIITFGGGNLTKGGTLVIPVSVENNPGFTGTDMEFIYDHDSIKITDIVADYSYIDSSRDETGIFNKGSFEGNKALGYLSWANARKSVDDGILFWLVIETSDDIINGTYTFSVKGTDDGPMFNYQPGDEEDILDYDNNKISVVPGEIVVTGGTDILTDENTVISGVEPSYEYGGAPVEPEPTVTYNGNVLVKDTDYTVSYESNNAVGNASLKVTGKGTYQGEVTKDFKITKKLSTITVTSEKYEKFYGDSVFNLGASVDSGETLSYVSDNSTVASVDTLGNVTVGKTGTAVISVSAPGNANYEAPETVKVTVKVSPATQEIQCNDEFTKTYGDPIFNLAASANGPLKYESKNEDVATVSATGDVTIKGAGTAIITVSTDGVEGEYGAATKDVTVNVSQKEITVSSGITAKDKVYDGTTDAELDTSAAVITGKVGADTLTVTATGTFEDANASDTPKTVAISDIKISGAAAKNYKLAENGNQETASASITKADYAGAEITGDVTVPAEKAIPQMKYELSSLNLPTELADAIIGSVAIDSDPASMVSNLTASADKKSFTYDLAAVAENSAATISVTLSSTNYNDVVAKVNLLAKSLTVDWESYFTAKSSMEYGSKNEDAFSKKATSGSASNVDGDLFNGTFEIVDASDIPSVASAHEITVNFTITDPGEYQNSVFTNTYTVDVTPKKVTITGVKAADKEYDGTVAAVFDASSAVVNGKVGTDDISIDSSAAKAEFADKNVGTNKTVSLDGFALTGADAANYVLSAQPASAKASITKKNLVVSGITIADKEYDGTTTATVSSFGTLSGVVASDTVSIDKTAVKAEFSDALPGDGKAVSVTGYDIKGTDAANYALTQPSGVTGNITKISHPQFGTSWSTTTYTDTAVSSDTFNLPVASIEGASYSNINVVSHNVVDGTPTVSSAGVLNYNSKACSAGDTDDITLTVSSDLYKPIALTVKVTATSEDVSSQIVFDDNQITYGDAVTTKSALVNNNVPADSDIEYTYIAVGDGAEVSGNVPVTAGTYTVIANYNDGTSAGTQTTTFTINKADPKGTPAFTAITSAGKTLADAALSIGSITPAGGVLSWDMGDTTTVTPNTSYSWTYVPADQNNYNTLKGSLIPYVSTGSSGGSSGGGNKPVTSTTPSAFTLIFNANGGSSIPQITDIEPNRVIELGSYVTSRDGYQFNGWFSDEELTTPVTSVTISANTTVYAKWTRYSLLPFTDVNLNDWFYDNVKYAYDNDYMKGTSGTLFSPFDSTSRGMIVTILYRMEGSPAVTFANTFPDVKAGEYYADAVEWAAKNGVVLGYGNGNYGPNDPITREQLCAILYRYSEYKDYDISFGDKTSLDPYVDADNVDEYAVPAMNWACSEGLINGTLNKELLPKDHAQRSQVAAILQRYLENFVKTEPKSEA